MTVLIVPGVTISGIGVISSAGVGGAALSRALRDGQQAGPEPARVRAFDPDAFIDPNRSRRMDPLSKMAVAAAWLAARDAGFELGSPGAPDPGLGVVFGTSHGCQATELRYADKLVAQGARFTNPIDFPDSIDGAPAAHVALELCIGGPSSTHADGALAGEHALLNAVMVLLSARADRVLVGAGDALTPVLEETSRHFGCPMPLGEAVAFVALEREEAAIRRGARVHGRLLALSQVTASGCRPHRLPSSGRGRRALDEALERVGLPAPLCFTHAGDSDGPLGGGAVVMPGARGEAVRLSPELVVGQVGAGGLVRLVAACLFAASAWPEEPEPSTGRLVATHATSTGGESFAVVVGGVRSHPPAEGWSGECASC